ncbi:hypothetical protein [Spirillospora sp. CA-294931]|uniref:hypothetical protein n=1 Tax=Spirillospora sp. CA-294931 TaxID=3240042 RepID=UPI003D936D84
MAFVELYGASAFGNDFLLVVDPRRGLQKSFAQWAREAGDDYRRWREQFPESHPMPAWV